MTEQRFKELMELRSELHTAIVEAAEEYARLSKNERLHWHEDDIYYIGEGEIELRCSLHMGYGRYDDYCLTMPMEFVYNREYKPKGN